MVNLDLENLKTLRNYFSDKGNWCQKSIQKYENGKTQYCLYGAILYLAKRELETGCNTVSEIICNKITKKILSLYNVTKHCTLGPIVDLNDNYGYEAVLNVLDKCIEDELK